MKNAFRSTMNFLAETARMVIGGWGVWLGVSTLEGLANSDDGRPIVATAFAILAGLLIAWGVRLIALSAQVICRASILRDVTK